MRWSARTIGAATMLSDAIVGTEITGALGPAATTAVSTIARPDAAVMTAPAAQAMAFHNRNHAADLGWVTGRTTGSWIRMPR